MGVMRLRILKWAFVQSIIVVIGFLQWGRAEGGKGGRGQSPSLEPPSGKINPYPLEKRGVIKKKKMGKGKKGGKKKKGK